MTQTTPAQAMVGELRALLEKATPGEWFRTGSPLDPDIRTPDGDDDPWHVATVFGCIDGTEDGANADFIIAAHNHMKALLDLIESLSARAGVEGDNIARVCDSYRAAVASLPSKPGGADREETFLEGNIRIAIWNGCRARGMSDEASYDLIRAIIASLKGEGL